jgi:hypothetical protein
MQTTMVGHRLHRMGVRGGVLLDLVIAAAVVLLGAFLLDLMGYSFLEVLQGAEHFFGA